jgi:hypothetical protein
MLAKLWPFIINCLKPLTELWSFLHEGLKLLRFINGYHKILTLGGISAVAALVVLGVLLNWRGSQAAPNPNPLTKVDAELAKVDALLQRADHTLDRVEPKQDRRRTHVAKRANARAPHFTATKTKFANTRAARGSRERELIEWAATSAGRALRSNAAPRELAEAVTAFRDALE